MLFRKRITRSCSYCAYGTRLNDTSILCTRKGVRDTNAKCCKFVYDPCKRTPVKMKASNFSKYDNKDFTI